MRPPVLIIGAHRSGTSATAHALQLLGLQIGQNLDSHYEPRPLQSVHDQYLKEVGASWHNPEPFLESMQTPEGEQRCVDYLRAAARDFAEVFGYRKNPRRLWMLSRIKLGAAWGWKEPRTTLFAAAWLKVFPGAKLLHVTRDEIAAARSIRERELKFRATGDSPNLKVEDLAYCLEIVRTYVRTAERLANRENYFRMRFEDLQIDPRGILTKAAEFCGLRLSREQVAAAAATIRPLPATTPPPT